MLDASSLASTVLGYRGMWGSGQDSNLHCGDSRLSFTFSFSFSLAGTQSLNWESVGGDGSGGQCGSTTKAWPVLVGLLHLGRHRLIR